MRVYVIRHAQSRQNVGDPEAHGYDARVSEYEAKDYSLTEKGLDQADRAGRRLSGVKLDAILCGPLHRHIATANEILKYQDNCKCIDILSDLTESDVCDYSGMPTELLCELFPEVEIKRHPASVTGGKDSYSSSELSDRVCERERAKRVVKYITERFSDDSIIAILASVNFFGGTLGSVLMKISDEKVDRITGFGCDNGSISLFEFKEGHSYACFINDILHQSVPDPEIISDIPLPMY